jgi:hypothetical protein
MGNELWVAHYDGLGNGIDRVHGMVLDDSGNVYVTGESFGSGTIYDYATVKYAGDGSEVWVARYDSPTNANDKAYALALDDNGYVYVTGESFGGPGAYMDYLTIKYSQETGIEEVVAKKSTPAMTVRNSIFVDAVEINYSLPEPTAVTLNIYDIQGRLVKILVENTWRSGDNSVRWDGCDENRKRLPGGVYLLRFATHSSSITRKVVKLR